MKDKILIYGVTGYTGKHISKLAAKQNLNIVVAARSNKNVDNYFLDNNIEVREFDLTDQEIIKENLKDIQLVVNAAGPFSLTNFPLIEACVQSKTHYIDIAGEYKDFERAKEFDQKAKIAGVMIMPGAGFGVVPTDIAAVMAKQKMPDATVLKIAYATVGGASKGTLKTILKDINLKGVQRINNEMVSTEPAHNNISFYNSERKKFKLVTNPWRADVFTASISTKVSTIYTYSSFPGIIVSFMKDRMLWLRNFLLNRLLKFMPDGPSNKQLEKGKTFVWVQAENDHGKSHTIKIEGPEAYLFTFNTVIEISNRIIKGDFKPGFQTPSIYGKELITKVKDVKIFSN